MHNRAPDAETRARTMAEMMVKLACLAAERVFPGPRVFHFLLQVRAFRDGMGAGVRSMVAPALPQP